MNDDKHELIPENEIEHAIREIGLPVRKGFKERVLTQVRQREKERALERGKEKDRTKDRGREMER